MSKTNRPGVALQSLYTAMIEAALNTYPASPLIKHNVTTLSTVTVLVPIRSRGLIIVLAVVAVIMLSNVFAIYIFLAHTRYSVIGDYWLAVAQVVSKESQKGPGFCVAGYR